MITKTGHAGPELAHYPGVEILAAGHPVPTSESLLAGARLLDWLRAAPAGRRMLFLITGGASSLVEAPAAGVSLDDLVRIKTWLLASGPDIDEMTAIRRRVSLIRGRDQHLTLAAAGLLAIGTDGSDGLTEGRGSGRWRYTAPWRAERSGCCRAAAAGGFGRLPGSQRRPDFNRADRNQCARSGDRLEGPMSPWK